ncbi:MAG: hypothetical protein PHO27_13130 [Sulfuricurvum sp.]|jgi:uncharacterized coiled-coil protein SlyX|nr:hypothetical protein [Sulfuricurvum sp.]
MAKKSFLEARIKQLEEMIHERDAKIIELAEKLTAKESKKKKDFDGTE